MSPTNKHELALPAVSDSAETNSGKLPWSKPMLELFGIEMTAGGAVGADDGLGGAGFS